MSTNLTLYMILPSCQKIIFNWDIYQHTCKKAAGDSHRNDLGA